MSFFVIKGTRPDGNICIYDGCQNPLNVTLNNPPLGFVYLDKREAELKSLEIVNSMVDITWSVISESEYIQLRIDWCNKYLKHYKPKTMGYHLQEFDKGIYGEFSKIKEEFEEFTDAVEQDDKILQMCELSDLIGAIEGYANQKFNLSLTDLINFSNKTKSAFKENKRF